MKIGLILLLIAFVGTLIGSILAGDFFKELGEITSLPWGRVMLYDLYIGFVLFSVLIIKIEQTVLKSAVWIISLCFLGNAISLLFLLVRYQKIKELFRGDTFDEI